jgi:hypothetical protein
VFPFSVQVTSYSRSLERVVVHTVRAISRVERREPLRRRSITRCCTHDCAHSQTLPCTLTHLLYTPLISPHSSLHTTPHALFNPHSSSRLTCAVATVFSGARLLKVAPPHCHHQSTSTHSIASVFTAPSTASHSAANVRSYTYGCLYTLTRLHAMPCLCHVQWYTVIYPALTRTVTPGLPPHVSSPPPLTHFPTGYHCCPWHGAP